MQSSCSGVLYVIGVLLTACLSNKEQNPTAVVKQSPTVTKIVSPYPTATLPPIVTDELAPTSTDVILPETQEVAPIPDYKPQAWTIYSMADIDITPPVIRFPYFFVYDIEKGVNGDMWFATTYGLVRFNGQKWELLEKEKENKYVPNSYIEIASDGAVWFTLYRGVYQRKNDASELMLKFSDFASDVYIHKSEADIFDIGGLEITPDGQVWVLLNGDLWHFDKGENLTPKSEDELPFLHTNGLVIDQNEHLYTWGYMAKADTGEAAYRGTAYGGLSCYEENKWAIYDQKEQYGIPASDTSGFSGSPLILDAQDNVWFYLWREGLFAYADDKFTLHIPYENDGYHPASMAFDQQGTLWLGNRGGETPLAKYVLGSDGLQTIDNSFTHHIHDDENKEDSASHNEIEQILPFEEVTALYVDSNNNLWIATELGVYVFDLDA